MEIPSGAADGEDFLVDVWDVRMTGIGPAIRAFVTASGVVPQRIVLAPEDYDDEMADYYKRSSDVAGYYVGEQRVEVVRGVKDAGKIEDV